MRAMLFDHNGQLLPDTLARRAYQFERDATLNARILRIWVEACVDEVLARGTALGIQAVGMITFAGNLLGVDQGNQALTPLYTYADKQSAPYARQLSQVLDMEAIHRRTGCRIHTAYHPAKLAWLRETRRDLFQQVGLWVDFGTYCYREWFGRDMPCSYSIASWSGLLDGETLQWDSEWLARLNLHESQLPRLADYDGVQRGLGADYQKRWPSLADVPFYLAIGDGAAANIGSGGVNASLPVLTVGTTTALRIITSEKRQPSMKLWAYRVDCQHQLIGGATNEGGNVLVWARETLGLPIETIDRVLVERPHQAHGLTILPLLAGERSPNYNEGATGTIHGITLQTTALDIVQAMMESVALQVRVIFEALDISSTVILAGGGAIEHSTGWGQIFADVLERPLAIVDTQEVSARGMALLIAAGSLSAIRLGEMRTARQFSPRLEYRDYYGTMLERQTQLYQRLYGIV